MLKNINIYIKNNKKKTEDIKNTILINENIKEPLCSFDIALDNGKKVSLLIYEGDDYEQKVENFCKAYKIYPEDTKVLLKRVKEDLEIKSNSDIMKNDKSDIISTESSKDSFMPEIDKLSTHGRGFVPIEENDLNRILNESESQPVYESVNKNDNQYKIDNIIIKNDNFYNNNINNKIRTTMIPTHNFHNKNSNNIIFQNNNGALIVNNNINKNTFSVLQNNTYNINKTSPINFIIYNKNITNPQIKKFYNVKENINKNKKKSNQFYF